MFVDDIVRKHALIDLSLFVFCSVAVDILGGLMVLGTNSLG